MPDRTDARRMVQHPLALRYATHLRRVIVQSDQALPMNVLPLRRRSSTKARFCVLNVPGQVLHECSRFSKLLPQERSGIPKKDL